MSSNKKTKNKTGEGDDAPPKVTPERKKNTNKIACAPGFVPPKGSGEIVSKSSTKQTQLEFQAAGAAKPKAKFKYTFQPGAARAAAATAARLTYNPLFVEQFQHNLLAIHVANRNRPDSYPGYTVSFERDMEGDANLMETAKIHFICHRRQPDSPKEVWKTAAIGKSGRVTEGFKNWKYFIRAVDPEKKIPATSRSTWATGIANAIQASHHKTWKDSQSFTCKFHQDETPSQGDLRKIGDVICSTEVVDIMRTMYSESSLEDILQDDDLLGMFFSECDFGTVRCQFAVGQHSNGTTAEQKPNTLNFGDGVTVELEDDGL